MPRTQPVLCHPDRPRNAKGLCSSCYHALLRGRPSKYLKRNKRTESVIDWVLRHRTEPDEHGCRLWTLGTNGKGYGVVFGTGTPPKLAAHRVVWEATNGPIPEGLFVCHRCDVRACC